MTVKEMLFCFRMDSIQPDTVVIVDDDDFDKFEGRLERRS